jgi:L-arabinose isomerase
VESNDGLECWFLTGSQALYGEETLRQVAEQSRHVVQALDAAPTRQHNSGSSTAGGCTP